MAKVGWTGHPFVDAGLAAIAAVAKVKRLDELKVEHLQRAVDELHRVLLSDQALGIGVQKAFARSAMSQIFPNSELVNPSNWRGKTEDEKAENVRRKFRMAVQEDLRKAAICLQTTGGDEICHACGEKTPKEAMVIVRKDKMPLLEGIVNFYPAFAYGMNICGMCALATRFLPISILRTGVLNRLWFLHTPALPVASKIAERYGWKHFDIMIAKNEALDFFGQWKTAGDAGTVIYLLCELLNEFAVELRQIYEHPLPTTAYVFSNYNKGGYVIAIPIPNELLVFFARLRFLSMDAFQRFWRELLQVPEDLQSQSRESQIRFVQRVAHHLIGMEDILTNCLDHETPKLLGGWIGHRLYLREMRKMSANKLSILERLGIKIAQSDDAKKRIMDLRKAERGDLYGIFLRYVREGWLKHDEFYTLLPPNEDVSAGEVRDVILAVIYEWQYCQERGMEFPESKEQIQLTPDETLKRIQDIGKRLIGGLPNPSRWISQFQTARSSSGIRGAYLLAVQRGALSFNDFIFLAPLGDRQKLWLLRDYLLAFLFEQAREILPEVDEIAGGEETPAAFQTLEGGEA